MNLRRVVILLLLFVTVIPVTVKAQNVNLSKYHSLTLEEALTEEGIEYNFDNYKENDKQVKIYLFRGKGCSHCYEFLEFATNTLIPEYGEMVKIVTYEIYNDSKNKELMNIAASNLNTSMNGVPFIIIGNKYWKGYKNTLDEEIIEEIKKQYKEEEKYDVFNRPLRDYTILWVIILVSSGVIFSITYKNKKIKALQKEIQSLKKKSAV